MANPSQALNQLTVRGVDEALAERLREHAARASVSISQAALDLMRRGAGLPGKPSAAPTIGHSLDLWFGTWSAEEAADFAQAVGDFAELDPELWP